MTDVSNGERYLDIDFQLPEAIAERARNGLVLARNLKNRRNLSPETITRMTGCIAVMRLTRMRTGTVMTAVVAK